MNLLASWRGSKDCWFFLFQMDLHAGRLGAGSLPELWTLKSPRLTASRRLCVLSWDCTDRAQNKRPILPIKPCYWQEHSLHPSLWLWISNVSANTVFEARVDETRGFTWSHNRATCNKGLVDFHRGRNGVHVHMQKRHLEKVQCKSWRAAQHVSEPQEHLPGVITCLLISLHLNACVDDLKHAQALTRTRQ